MFFVYIERLAIYMKHRKILFEIFFIFLSFFLISPSCKKVNEKIPLEKSKGVFIREKGDIEKVDAYAQYIAPILLEDIKGKEKYFDIRIENYKSLYLGAPFRVYGKTEDNVIYYPVYEGDTIKLILTVLEKNGKWNAVLGRSWSEDFEEIHGNATRIVTKNECSICVEPYDENVVYPNNNISVEEFSPDISLSNLFFSSGDSKLLGTPDNYKNQKDEKGNTRGMCWAASIATTINCRTGSDVTAQEICEEMKIPLDEGVRYPKKEEALKKHGISVASISRRLNWSEIKENISDNRPIMVSLYSENEAHAVTIVGYSEKEEKMIYVWDSVSGFSIKTYTPYFTLNGNIWEWWHSMF